MTTSPGNKGRIIGQKRPLPISHIWGIRIRLQLEGKVRDLALFNMALDSKLRGCDLVKLKVSKGTREAVAAWIKMAHLRSSDSLFQSCVGSSRHISTRQYNRIFHGWIDKLVWTRLCTVRILCEEPSHI